MAIYKDNQHLMDCEISELLTTALNFMDCEFLTDGYGIHSKNIWATILKPTSLEQSKKYREEHMRCEIKPNKIPMLWIRNKITGHVHLYGTNSHDSLTIDSSGNLQYYNLQCGEGTGAEGSFEFIDHDEDGMIYYQILHYYPDEDRIY